MCIRDSTTTGWSLITTYMYKCPVYIKIESYTCTYTCTCTFLYMCTVQALKQTHDIINSLACCLCGSVICSKRAICCLSVMAGLKGVVPGEPTRLSGVLEALFRRFLAEPGFSSSEQSRKKGEISNQIHKLKQLKSCPRLE